MQAPADGRGDGSPGAGVTVSGELPDVGELNWGHLEEQGVPLATERPPFLVHPSLATFPLCLCLDQGDDQTSEPLGDVMRATQALRQHRLLWMLPSTYSVSSSGPRALSYKFSDREEALLLGNSASRLVCRWDSCPPREGARKNSPFPGGTCRDSYLRTQP